MRSHRIAVPGEALLEFLGLVDDLLGLVPLARRLQVFRALHKSVDFLLRRAGFSISVLGPGRRGQQGEARHESGPASDSSRTAGQKRLGPHLSFFLCTAGAVFVDTPNDMSIIIVLTPRPNVELRFEQGKTSRIAV